MLFRFVALLRGINVGDKNKLGMKSLAAMFNEAGCLDVVTYIQSGNVVFTAPEDLSATIPDQVSARIFDELGFRAPITIRSADQMKAIVEGNPMLDPKVPEDTLHVMFLLGEPTPEQIQSLNPARSLPDTFLVKGREVYLNLPNGVADTKLTNAYFDSKLATVATSRNWRTVKRLLELVTT